jgi:hypothetical protein
MAHHFRYAVKRVGGKWLNQAISDMSHILQFATSSLAPIVPSELKDKM